MAYAEVTHINYRLNGFAGLVIDGNSYPNSTAVGTFLDEASALIDSALTKAGYDTVPATGENDLILLRKIVADYVAYQTYATAFGHDTVPESLVAIYGDTARFLAYVDDIESGKMLLQDQSTSQGTFRVGTLTLRIDADENDVTTY